jgi:hypothetical protein
MKGMLVRLARALNAVWCRRGRVFADRFHSHALRTPKEVRAALVYVLLNARRHGLALAEADPCSSARWFDGWMRTPSFGVRMAMGAARGDVGTPVASAKDSGHGTPVVATKESERGNPVAATKDPGCMFLPTPFRSPVAPAQTWLLREGWRRHGLVGIDEWPRRWRTSQPRS